MIIGLHGEPGSGKDTVGEFLYTKHDFCVYRMADPLKFGLSRMFNIPLEDIENQDIKNLPSYKFGKSIRYLMQTLGTEWGRNMVEDDVWIKMAIENIENIENRESTPPFMQSNIVITDIRFDNEAKMVQDMGGHVIEITRPHNESNGLTAGVQNHTSNAGIIPSLIDRLIINDGTVTQLYKKVDDFMFNISRCHG